MRAFKTLILLCTALLLTYPGAGSAGPSKGAGDGKAAPVAEEPLAPVKKKAPPSPAKKSAPAVISPQKPVKAVLRPDLEGSLKAAEKTIAGRPVSKLSVNVRNAGKGRVSAAYETAVILRPVGPKLSPVQGDGRIGSLRCPSPLAPGKGGSCSGSALVPRDTPSGEYRLCADFDAGGSVAETDEKNNLACIAVQVTPELKKGILSARKAPAMKPAKTAPGGAAPRSLARAPAAPSKKKPPPASGEAASPQAFGRAAKKMKEEGLEPKGEMMAAAPARPLSAGASGSSLPGTPRGLTVFLDGGVAVRHPGDVMTVHFNYDGVTESPGFPPMGSDAWRYLALHPVYIHDADIGIDSMGLWPMVRYDVVDLAEDGRGGTFRITVPDTLPEGSNYAVTIIRDSGAYGHSARFPVWPHGAGDRAIRVLTPDGGETWPRGTDRTISWMAYEFEVPTGDAGMGFRAVRTFIFELLRFDAVTAAMEVEDVSCERETHTCTGRWPIPVDTPPGSVYKVRIRHGDEVSLTGEPLGDDSDAAFSITAPAITLETPAAGEEYTVLGRLPLRGTVTGIREGFIDCDILSYGAVVKHFGQPIPEDGNLLINLYLASDCDDPEFAEVFRHGRASYTLRIRHRDWPLISTETPPFSIAVPSVAVTSPSGGERWRIGDVHTIRLAIPDRWSSEYGNFSIFAELGGFMGTESACIGRSIDPFRVHEYPWAVGRTCDGGTLVPGTTYRIRVRADDCADVEGLSAGDFTIIE